MARAQSNIKGWGQSVFDSSWNSETAFVEVAAGERSHGGAAERRLRRRVGGQRYGQCNVPALPAGLTYVEVAAGAVAAHGGAPERRLRRRVGGQRLRPVQRSGASGRAHLRRGRGGRLITRWRGGATAPSSRGGTTTTASATCRRFRPGSPTSRSRRAAWSHGGAAERRLRRRVGVKLLRPVQRSGASGRAHLRRGRGGRWITRWRGGATAPSSRGGTTTTASATFRRFRPGSPTSRSRRAASHTVARRSDGSVVAWGDNSYGQCNVPALPGGLTYVEVAAGGRSHGGAPERRLRRRVGEQRLRPVQRSGASGRAHLRRGRGGRLVTRWRGGATAPSSRGGTTARPVQRSGASGRAHLRRGRGGRLRTRWRGGATAPWSRGGTTTTASATCRRFRSGSPTSRSRRATVTRWRAGATAPSSRGGTTPTASATFRRFRPGSPTSRSRRAAVHTVARRSDGSVVAWGTTRYGQCNVPALPAGLTYVEVAAGDVATRWRAGATAPWSRGGTTPTASATFRRFRAGSPTSRSRRATCHTVARRSDGSVVAWGDNAYGQCNVPALPAGLTYVEVAAGGLVTRWRGTMSPLRSCLSAQVAVVRACQSSAATRRASGQTSS